MNDLHPTASGDAQRLVDYWTGRHDEREHGDGSRALAELEFIAEAQRRAVGIVHRVADAVRNPDAAPASLLRRHERMARYERAAERIEGELEAIRGRAAS